VSERSVRDVVLSSRVRLARNFADIPFPAAMGSEDGETAQSVAANALAHTPQGRQYTLLRMQDLPAADRWTLAERHLISRELAAAGASMAALLKQDEHVCIMLNEEDHVRIHALLPGNALDKAAALAFEADDAIGDSVWYAFDGEFGFLTSNPANVGTGMRVSALLHLPALTRAGAIGDIVRETANLGLALRPLYVEDGKAQAELYLLHNQVALGLSEQDLLDSMNALIEKIVEHERTGRELLLMRDDTALEDQLMRSLGILRYARKLSLGEWLHRWSDVRLAVQAGMLHMPLDALDDLLSTAQAAHLEKRAGRPLSPSEQDEARAQLVRELLGAYYKP